MRMPNQPKVGSHEQERTPRGKPRFTVPRRKPISASNGPLDGSGQGKIDTSIRFFDHMLDLLPSMDFFDLTVQAKGDIEIDEHHTVEDVGIVMGKALHQALGRKGGIKRFGWASVPLDETLAQVTVDLSGRPYLVYNVNLPDRKDQDIRPGFVRRLLPGFCDARWVESSCQSSVRAQSAPHHGSHL